MEFRRVCPVHREQLMAEYLGRKETLYCPNGHTCESFLVLTDENKVFARAYRGREDVTDGPGDENIPRPPTKPCKHGHMEWSWQKSSKRYRCAVCNRPSYKKQRSQTHA